MRFALRLASELIFGIDVRIGDLLFLPRDVYFNCRLVVFWRYSLGNVISVCLISVKRIFSNFLKIVINLLVPVEIVPF